MNNRRIGLAFALSPLATPLVFVFAVAYRTSTFNALRLAPILFLLYISFAYLATAVLGFPAFILYRALGWRNGLLYVLGGAVIGLLTSLVLKVGSSWSVNSGDYVWCTVAGAVSAFVFWMILFKLKVGKGDRLP